MKKTIIKVVAGMLTAAAVFASPLTNMFCVGSTANASSYNPYATYCLVDQYDVKLGHEYYIIDYSNVDTEAGEFEHYNYDKVRIIAVYEKKDTGFFSSIARAFGGNPTTRCVGAQFVDTAVVHEMTAEGNFYEMK